MQDLELNLDPVKSDMWFELSVNSRFFPKDTQLVKFQPKLKKLGRMNLIETSNNCFAAQLDGNIGFFLFPQFWFVKMLTYIIYE